VPWRRDVIINLPSQSLVAAYAGRQPDFGDEWVLRDYSAAVPSSEPRGTVSVRLRKGLPMTGVRVLVGTRKGAFVLNSDGKREKWEVSGPHFAGWEIYHVKGSPVDQDRLYASHSSGCVGQVIHRSDRRGVDVET